MSVKKANERFQFCKKVTEKIKLQKSKEMANEESYLAKMEKKCLFYNLTAEKVRIMKNCHKFKMLKNNKIHFEDYIQNYLP